jgi:hypothetical protein
LPTTGLDRYDIEKLMELHGKTLDWKLVTQYFEIFESMDLFEELERKYRADK